QPCTPLLGRQSGRYRRSCWCSPQRPRPGAGLKGAISGEWSSCLPFSRRDRHRGSPYGLETRIIEIALKIGQLLPTTLCERRIDGEGSGQETVQLDAKVV